MNIALKIKNLTKTYPKGVEALKGIDLNVQQGDFFALLGPNGAGKSTAIGIITSLVNKTSGDVEVFGHNIETHSSQAKSCLGLVPQEFNFGVFEKIIHILINQAGYYGLPRSVAMERAEKYLKKLDLWDKGEHAARTLSGGMKRRLMIARALIHEPKLLILDEPTAGVDIEIRRSMWDFLRELNKSGVTIILTTHYLEEAENLCKNIAIIDHGKIVENTTMKKLLTKLDSEVFVLDLAQAWTQDLPKAPAEMEFNVIDEKTLEVTIHKSHSLNDLFNVLSNHQIQVISMRNKTNRLEELFVNLTKRTQIVDGKEKN